MDQNGVPQPGDVAARIARRTLSKRGADYEDEVRRLLDAAMTLIQQHGTSSQPRVADIVAAAGLSNEAFYRHFPSKDALVAALIEDGTERLAGYLEHQMGKESVAEAKVRRWVEGVLSQARGEIAATTLAVLWNGSTLGASGRQDAARPLARLLHGPFAELGSGVPELDAVLVAHAALGMVSEHLWQETAPGRAEADAIVAFALAAIRRPVPAGKGRP